MNTMTTENRIVFARILTVGALLLAAVASWSVTGSLSKTPDLVIKASVQQPKA